MRIPSELINYFQAVQLPKSDSHKGQNGKVCVIGGSDLFHAASRWSMDVASKLVDMVFYSSVSFNNELIKEAKGKFWNGIVVPREQLGAYIEEADCVLIGPGMERNIKTNEHKSLTKNSQTDLHQGTQIDWQHNTAEITNFLLRKYPQKKWVVDAGALQMVDPTLLPAGCIITPHAGELVGLLAKVGKNDRGNKGEVEDMEEMGIDWLVKRGVIILEKGEHDSIYFLKEHGQDAHGQMSSLIIEGGHPGMTKGGTGDVLAGLVAGLYATQPALTAAVVGSLTNKVAGENLAQKVGPYFNSTDLVSEIPQALWQLITQAQANK